MAEDNNGDVDRAMAAFAAAPIPYFTAANASYSEAPRSTATAAPGSQQSRPKPAAFPLLVAALPEICQAPMPAPPNGADALPAQSTISGSLAKKAELLTRRAKALHRPIAQPPEMISVTQQTTRARLSATVGPSVRHVQPAETRSAAIARAPGIRSTPIATMFNALQGETPAQDGPAETRPDLQGIFSRL